MKKVISFALWGTNTLYTHGAIKNAQSRDVYFKDWVRRFYLDNSVPIEVVTALETLGCEIIEREPLPDVLGMYWRFAPFIDDGTISHFLSRDTDSQFTKREEDAVNYWLDSGLPFHIIRDNVVHNIPILGGTFGAKPGCIPNFDIRLSQWFSSMSPMYGNPRGVFHGTDQQFLEVHVWPIIKESHIAHIFSGDGKDKLKFTGHEIELPPLIDGHYIGMVC